MHTLVIRAFYTFVLASGAVSPVLITPGCHTTSAEVETRHNPEPPRQYVDTRYVAPTGRTLNVAAGGDFQAALDHAAPGDLIVLQAGAVYTGPFTLPAKHGDGWITVQSSAMSTLPPPGGRVTPTDAPAMPKLEAASQSVMLTANGAHHYRFIGLEIRPGAPVAMSMRRALGWLHDLWHDGGGREPAGSTPAVAFLENLVNLGNADTNIATLPHHIIFDRCYLHGDPVVGARRGVAMNGANIAVIDSYLSDFKEAGEDSQALSAWNGPGPFKITDDYLEAAGENVMFGGEDPSIPNLVPSDIEVRGNHFSKQLAWKSGDPGYQGTNWTIKNLFELKNAQRVLVEGNVFEYNWAQSQDGFSVLFTVRDQNGSAPWSVVQDVSFTDNVIRHVANGVNVLGFDNNAPSRQTQRILIANNLFDDVGGVWGQGVLLAMNDGTLDVHVMHNTSLQTGSIVFSDGHPHSGFRYADNIAPHNAYGIIGTNTGVGDATLEVYFPDADVHKNVIIGAPAAAYPSGNYFPRTIAGVNFIDAASGDYRLAPGSDFHSAGDDGKDIGADIDELCAALRTYGGISLANNVPSCFGKH
ncbi:MAG: hypothetical protein ACM3ZT_02165 [Bacillota bacterium]